MQIAHTILEQLGGNQFRAMTGAKQLLALESGLQFDLPARLARDGIRKVRVELTAADLYRVTFYQMKRERLAFGSVNTPVVVREDAEVYADQLRATFTAATGLDTSL